MMLATDIHLDDGDKLDVGALSETVVLRIGEMYPRATVYMSRVKALELVATLTAFCDGHPWITAA